MSDEYVIVSIKNNKCIEVVVDKDFKKSYESVVHIIENDIDDIYINKKQEDNIINSFIYSVISYMKL